MWQERTVPILVRGLDELVQLVVGDLVAHGQQRLLQLLSRDGAVPIRVDAVEQVLHTPPPPLSPSDCAPQPLGIFALCSSQHF